MVPELVGERGIQRRGRRNHDVVVRVRVELRKVPPSRLPEDVFQLRLHKRAPGGDRGTDHGEDVLLTSGSLNPPAVVLGLEVVYEPSCEKLDFRSSPGLASRTRRHGFCGTTLTRTSVQTVRQVLTSAGSRTAVPPYRRTAGSRTAVPPYRGRGPRAPVEPRIARRIVRTDGAVAGPRGVGVQHHGGHPRKRHVLPNRSEREPPAGTSERRTGVVRTSGVCDAERTAGSSGPTERWRVCTTSATTTLKSREPPGRSIRGPPAEPLAPIGSERRARRSGATSESLVSVPGRGCAFQGLGRNRILRLLALTSPYAPPF
jgi:hypothetical protein